MLLLLFDANNRAEIPATQIFAGASAVLEAVKLPGASAQLIEVRTDPHDGLVQASSEADGFEYLVIYDLPTGTLTLSFATEAERNLYLAAVEVARERRR